MPKIEYKDLAKAGQDFKGATKDGEKESMLAAFRYAINSAANTGVSETVWNHEVPQYILDEAKSLGVTLMKSPDSIDNTTTYRVRW